MDDWQTSVVYLTIAAVMVLLNGFFVAAEFALVKVRGGQLDELAKQGKVFSKTARWLGNHLDGSLSACQLGITMASLALGWVGEPAFARLLEPLFHAVGITSEAALHTSAFIVAFTIITTLHLVIGEQVPKIYAIRRPEQMMLWCAVPLMFFYVLLYPFLVTLNYTTRFILRLVGIEGASEDDAPHSEAEIRTLIHQAVSHGEISRSEHQLLHAVFEFDDMICRRVMVPRSEAVFFDIDQPLSECLEIVQRTQHTRYPLCEDSLEKVLGIVHIKDLIGVTADSQVDLRELVRPLHHVPETMATSQLLRHFQKTHQLMALVVDEYGTVVGIVTLENVLEQIIGPVEDEFDTELPDISPEGDGRFIVQGSTSLDIINERFGLELDAIDVDTMAGIMLERVGRVLEVGDRVDFGAIMAEVIEVEGARATRIRVTQPETAPDADEDEPASDQSESQS